MADRISSLRTGGTGPSLFDELSTNGQLGREERYGLVDSGESQFTKGTRVGAAGLTAGEQANEALRQEVSGNQDFTLARDQALGTAQEAQMYAPRVSSLRDINSVGDAGDYAAGAIGQGAISMAPSIAGAVLLRGRGLGGKAASFAGAAAPAYEMERGEAALGQYQDPALAATSAEDRDAAASVKGVVNAGLESIVPAGLAGSVLRKPAGSLLGHVGREALTEGATEAAQQGVGFLANKSLDPSKELDPWDLADAFAGGALTGGAMSGVLRGPAHAAEAVLGRLPKDGGNTDAASPAEPDLGGVPPTPVDPNTPLLEGPDATYDDLGTLGKAAKFASNVNDRFGDDFAAAGEKAKDLGAKGKSVVDDALDRMNEAVKTSNTPQEFLRAVFGSDISDEAQVDLDGGTPANLRGATDEETAANIDRFDETKPERAARYADELLNDEITPDSVKERVASFGGDFTSPEAQSYVAATLVAQRGGEKLARSVNELIGAGKELAGTAVEKGNELAGSAVNAGLKAGEAVKDVAGKAKAELDSAALDVQERIIKKNLQDASPTETAAFNKVVFDGLTDVAKGNPEVRAKLGQVTNALMAFAAKTGDIKASDLPTLTKLSDALSMFKDPAATAQQIAEYAGIPRFEDSFLARVQKIQNAQSEYNQPGSFLQSALTDEAKNTLTSPQLKQVARVIDEFSLAEGASKKKADAIVNGLAQAFGSPEAAKAVLDYYSQQNRADVKFDENAALAPDSGFQERGEPETSYQFKDAKTNRPYSVLRGSVRSKESTRAALDVQTTAGENAQAKAVPYSEYASKKGLDADAETKRIAQDIKDRIAQHEKRTGEDRTEQVNALKGELSAMRQAYKEGGAKKALDMYEVLAVSDKEQNDTVATDEDIKSFAKLADAKDGKATRVTFKRKDGTKLALSAESMWKSLGTKEGSGKGETTRVRAKRLFADAVASVLARPDIESLETDLKGVVLDRATNLQAENKPRSPEYRENVKGALEAANSNTQALKKRLKDVTDEYYELLDDFTDPESESRRAEINEIIQQNIDNNVKRMDDLKATPGSQPAQAVLRERQRQYLDAQAELRAAEFEAEQDYNDNNREGMAVAKEDGSRVRQQTDTSSGPRFAEEDTGLGIGQEKRGDRSKKPSAQQPRKGRPGKVDEAAIKAEVKRIRGDKVKVAFDTFANIGGSGEFSMTKDKRDRLIKIARNSMNPMSVAWHESLHDFMAMLGGDPAVRKLKADLLAAAEAPQVVKRLKELLAGHPEALKQIETDREERLAYMYQFWAEGLIPLGKTGNGIFARFQRWLNEMLGVMSEDGKTAAYFEALHEGKFSDVSIAAEVIKDLKADTLSDKLKRASGPIGEGVEKGFTAATDRLRNTNIDALTELADLFHREPGREGGGLPFMQRRAQQVGKKLNQLQAILGETTAVERRQALDNLQSMKAPSNKLEREIAKYLAGMHTYMTDNGVKRYDDAAKQWKPLGQVKNYFPRSWDKNAIRNNEDAFQALLEKYITKEQAKNTIKALINGDGSLELAESEHSLGFTPWNPSVLDRKFTFIDASNAADFIQFQSKDLAETLTTYTQRAVHRAEYAKDFGNDAEVITEKLVEAKKQGATNDELEMAKNATMAMEGTLGYDVNPRLKEFMSGVMTYENIVLLPLSLFSSLIDPLGVAMRSNDMKEAGKAFLYGMKGIADAVRRKGPDEAEEMAKLLGLIDDQNMLEAMGHVYNSMYMSKFLKNINSKFFRFNGMELWNQRMRVSAMMAAQRFIVKNINHKRYMDELGLQKTDVFEKKDGTIALTKDDLLAAGAPKSDVSDIEKRVQAAVFKFVDGAVLRPNAAHRPIWGSDPRFQLIFHLKQFTFSFHNTILRRVNEELRHGNVAPSWILLSYVPFMFVSDVMRGSLTGTLNSTADLYDIASKSIARSGILGTATFGSDAIGDAQRGSIPGTSFLGPAFDHLMKLVGGVFGNISAEQVLDRSIPLAKYA